MEHFALRLTGQFLAQLDTFTKDVGACKGTRVDLALPLAGQFLVLMCAITGGIQQTRGSASRLTRADFALLLTFPGANGNLCNKLIPSRRCLQIVYHSYRDSSCHEWKPSKGNSVHARGQATKVKLLTSCNYLVVPKMRPLDICRTILK